MVELVSSNQRLLPTKGLEFCNAWLFLSFHWLSVEDVSGYPIFWFNSVHPILGEAPTIFVPLISSAYGQRLNQRDIERVYVIFKPFWVPCFWLPIINSRTDVIRCTTGAIGLAGLAGIVGIQWFSQALISFPEWTLCLIPNIISLCTIVFGVRCFYLVSTFVVRVEHNH